MRPRVGRLARRYAAALCEVARERGLLERVELDLRRVEEMLTEEAFRGFFYARHIPREEKQRLLKETLGEAVCETTLSFLYLLVRNNREELLNEIGLGYREAADRARGILEAWVRTPVKLSEETASSLQRKLSQSTGMIIRLREERDPSLLGGMIVQIGDTVIDGSAATRLKLLEEALKSTNHG